jgi:hypothetical protein
VPTNFSVTAGAGNDSLLDSLTAYGTDTGLGGEVRGNYCTWNPLNTAAGTSISNGALDLTTGSGAGQTGTTLTTFGLSSGKWYWEVIQTATTNSSVSFIGIAPSGYPLTSSVGYSTTSYAYVANGLKITNSATSSYGASYTNGDVVGVALDLDAGTLTFYKNGVSQGVAFTGITSGTYHAAVSDNGSAETSSFTANFGQRPFAYAAPSGFKALNTQNLPTTTVGFGSDQQANDYFDTVLYTGNGTSQTVTGLQFKPDFVWIKLRNESPSSTWHRLIDSVRGGDRRLSSNDTQAEAQSASLITAFTANGFSVGNDAGINSSGINIVAWCWRAGGNAVVNTAGTIQSNVSVNTTAGFSIVTYTGNSTAGATVGHGLGAAPSMIILKSRTSAGGWAVYHTSLGPTQYIWLMQTSSAATYSGAWNNTAPTSSVFTLGNDGQWNGAYNFVAYCWAAVPGFSAFGSYTGNGSADGPFVYTGFRPRWVLIKVSTGTPAADWVLHDTSRSPYNVSDIKLSPNTPTGDVTSSAVNIDILSSGFKIRNTDGAYNTSTNTYIYAAFAESPFKTARSR